jgi:hypothetical protein
VFGGKILIFINGLKKLQLEINLHETEENFFLQESERTALKQFL